MRGRGCVAEREMWPLGVVVVGPSSNRLAGMARLVNSVSFKGSSRMRPLKLSTVPFWIGLPGAM